MDDKLTKLEIFNTFFNITEDANKFVLYTDTFDDFSFEKLKNELEEILSISDITPSQLQHEVMGPRIIEDHNKLILETSNTDGSVILIMGYARSPFRDFESYLRIVVGLDEDDIQLIFRQYSSVFVTSEKPPGVYLIKDISEAM